jgi:YVTN family beta-propeller protein
MKRAHMVGGLLGLFAPCILSAQANTLEYRLAVVSESGDIATWLKPTVSGLAVDRVVPLGIMPSDIDGPHHVAVAPDATSYYVSIAHGTPFGSLWKLDAHTHLPLGRAEVELFPTTIGLTPDGQFAFVANSDFHGDHPRSNVVSVVHTPTMTKITDVPACDMPHGVKVNHAGTRAYVTCMHSDEVLEFDVATLAISRRASVGAGHSGAGTACSPTYVSVSRDDSRLYLACNHSNTLQVWDALALRPVKELAVGAGAYNVEPSPDGRTVIVSNKKAQSISLIDARTLTETARIPTSKKLVHGVAYSPDSRLAYVTCESIGMDPGAVDVIDVAARKRVASLSIPGQPTGIAVLPSASSTARR